jgi:3-methyladenine DNA glycosylase AlkD
MTTAKRDFKPIAYTKAVQALHALADPKRAQISRGYFKDTQGDVFLGVPTPAIRKLARQFYLLPLGGVRKLMRSRVHEERSLAHAILRLKFEKSPDDERGKIFDFFIKNRSAIRSWDGVDDSAPYIVGPYLLERNKKLLYQLVQSARLWDRRIAIVSTWCFIREGRTEDTLKLAAMLLEDEEDLIHKATGWMLREVGKRNLPALKRFLQLHGQMMPRTTLRYAIERFAQRERRRYLQGVTRSGRT